MGNLFSTPDDEFSRQQREKAQEYAEKASECFEQSKEAYNRNEHERAKHLSMEGKKYQALMKEANRKAADAIYRHLNAAGKQPLNTVDLHGLYVREALEKLEKAVNAARRNKETSLVVVVGRGNNSLHGPKIKPAVRQFAERNAIRYELNTPNYGCIKLEFDVDQPSFCVIC